MALHAGLSELIVPSTAAFVWPGGTTSAGGEGGDEVLVLSGTGENDLEAVSLLSVGCFTWSVPTYLERKCMPSTEEEYRKVVLVSWALCYEC